MKAMSNKTIEEIKKSSSYTIDPLKNLYNTFVDYYMLFGQFPYIFKNYKFEENIMEIK